MIEAFELDTSGVVTISRPEPGLRVYGIMAWSDLSPFEQGFTRAALESLHDEVFGAGAISDGKRTRYVGFSDLHPSTLARFLKDCERFKSDGYGWADDDDTDGALLWATRQAGEWADVGFGPLRLSSDSDGKIIVEEPTL